MALRQLTITVDATNPHKPAVAVDASSGDPQSVAWAAQNRAQLNATSAATQATFYAFHTADDHPRQRQKLATTTQLAMIAVFVGDTFSIATASGVVAAAAKGV